MRIAGQLRIGWVAGCALLAILLLLGPWTGAQQWGARYRPATMPTAQQIAQLPLQGKRSVRVHDPSHLAFCDGEYWIFATGDKVKSLRSPDLIHWQAGPVAFSKTPVWVAAVVPANRNFNCWAPEIYFDNGTYYLYYSVSRFATNVSAIGLATNSTLNPADKRYAWKDQGPVIQSTKNDRFNAIDPSIIKDQAGRLWMVFGSFWSGIKMIELDPQTKMRISPDSPITNLAYASAIEGASICWHDGFYYLLVDWGLCCRGLASTYDMRVGRSMSITGPYLDRDGRPMMYGGGTEFMNTDGAFIGPGHCKIFTAAGLEWVSCHFYDGSTRRGLSMLSIRPMHWTTDGWPVADRDESNAATTR